MIELGYGQRYGAPCAFVLVRGPEAVLIDSDWDYPALARNFGFRPCRRCDATDGTVDCDHAAAGIMIARAFDYLSLRVGRRYAEWGVIGRQLAEYFPERGS